MRTRLRTRKAASALSALILAAGITAGLSVVSAQAADTSAADRFASCIAAQHRADVVVLLDESGSLDDTDPADARVDAAKFLLRKLVSLAEDGGADIAVRLSSFGNRYEAETDWVKASNGTLSQLTSAAEKFRDKDAASGTDYWLGLDGARKDLKARQSSDEPRCQAIIFFSDGQLDIQPAAWESVYDRIGRPYAEHNPLGSAADREAATKAAAKSLCRPGGLADQVRKQDIITFGIGLSPAGDDGKFDLMKSVVTGSDSCGAIADPVPGMFTSVRNIDDLLFAFDAAAGQSGTQTKAPVCQGAICAEGAHRIVLDETISKVTVLASAPVDDVNVYLTAPNDEQVKLAHADVESSHPIGIDGVKGSYAWQSAHTVSIEWVAAGALQWTGQWQVAFVDARKSSPDAMSRTSIQVKGNLVPALTSAAPTQLRQDTPIKLAIGVTDREGKPVDLSQARGKVTMDVGLAFGDGSERVVSTGVDRAGFGKSVDVNPADFPLGDATLSLVLHVTTADLEASGKTVPGTELSPESADFPVVVLPPANFPTSAGQLDFGTLDGQTVATAALKVTGPGCVWLDPAKTKVQTAPEESGDVVLEAANHSSDTCLRVAAGATADLPVTLRAASPGNGSVSGEFTVALAAEDDLALTHPLGVHFSAELVKTLNQPNFVITLSAAILLGLGLPVGLVYLLKFVLNSKIPGGLNYALIDVLSTDGELRRPSGTFALENREVQLLNVPSGGARRANAGGVDLVSRFGWQPFGAATVQIGGAGTRSAAPGAQAGAKPARLALSLAGRWAVVKDAGSEPGAARLLAFFTVFATPEQRQAVLDKARLDAPKLITALERVGAGPTVQADPDGPDDHFGDSGSLAGGGTAADDYSFGD